MTLNQKAKLWPTLRVKEEPKMKSNIMIEV
jgi:hypothetical protein